MDAVLLHKIMNYYNYQSCICHKCISQQEILRACLQEFQC